MTQIFTVTRDDGVAVITMDLPGELVNKLNTAPAGMAKSAKRNGERSNPRSDGAPSYPLPSVEARWEARSTSITKMKITNSNTI